MIGARSFNLGSLYIYLRGNNTSFMNMMNVSEKRIYTFGKTVQAAGVGAIMKLTAPLALIGGLATREFGKFDQAMTKSLSIMKDVTPELRKMMEMEAFRISNESINSATDLANAYYRLGSAGYSAAQQLKALDVINKFAVAGHMDLDTATRLAVDSQTTLGMRYEDAEKNAASLYKITNVLTKANTLANATVEEYAYALGRYGAAAMRAYNMELEEGVAMLAAYASQSIKGEHAGNMMSRMIRLSTAGFLKNRRAWEGFGIDIYDANRNLKPVYTLIQELEKKYASLGTEARTAALAMLGFQARSQQAVFPLMGLGEQMEKFYNELKKDTTFIDSVYKDVMSSFSNQLKVVWNNVKNVSIQIGDIMAPAVLKFAYRIKELSEWFRNLEESQKKAIVKTLAWVAALGPGLWILGKLITTFTVLTTVVRFFFTTVITKMVQLTIAMLTNPIGLIVAAIVAAVLTLVMSLYVLRAAWNNNFMNMKEYWQQFLDFIKVGVEWIANSAFGKLITWLVKTWIGAFKDLKDNFVGFVKGIVSLTAANIAFLNNIWKGPQAAKEAWAQAFLYTDELVQTSFDNVKQTVVETLDIVEGVIGNFVAVSKEILGELWDDVEKQFSEDIDTVVSMLKSKLPQLKGVTDEMLKSMVVDYQTEQIMGGLGGANQGVDDLYAQQKNQITDHLDKMKLEIDLLGKGNKARTEALAIDRFRLQVQQAFPGALKYQNELVEEYKRLQKELYEGGRSFDIFRDKLIDFSEQSTNIWSSVADTAINAMNGISDGITEMLTGGEFSFRAFAASIIKELIRIMVQAIVVSTILAAMGIPMSAGASAFSFQSGFGFGGGAAKPGMGTPGTGGVHQYHTGGVVGQGPLNANERVLVAETGELVLSKEDLAGARNNNAGGSPNNIKVVNVLDKKEMLSAMSTVEGEKVVMNIMRRNKGMISSMMG